MTPQQYINELRSCHPQQEPEIDLISDTLAWAGTSVAEVQASMHGRDCAQILMDDIRAALDGGIGDILDHGQVAVGMIGIETPDVYCKKMAAHQYAIVMNTGMTKLIYRVARIVATRFTPIGQNANVELIDPDLGQVARYIAEVFLWLQENGTFFGPQYEISNEQKFVASSLASNAERFLLSHEVGHIMDEMAESCSFALPISIGTAGDIHRDEFMADRLGLIIAMDYKRTFDLNDPGSGFSAQLLYAGVEFALQIWRVLEKIGFSFQNTHPPAELRLEQLREEARSRCLNQESWATTSLVARFLDQLFVDVVAIIKNPDARNEQYDMEARQVVAQLDSLLDRCTCDDDPDDLQFFCCVGEVFDRGYPETLLKRIEEITAEAEYSISDSINSSPPTPADTAKAKQKHYLLTEYVSIFAPEEVRTMFLRALTP